jgi:hypothetical protein
MRKLIYRTHALQRMFERGVSVDEISEVIEHGEELRAYPDDYPYPSRLLVGFPQGRPLHVVRM